MSEHHVCPWWMGYLLASPIRKLKDNPGNLLGPYIKEGMTVLDIGSAMGFFSLPMARMAGEHGKVICVDLQEKMLSVLKKRAVRAGLSGRIEARRCNETSLLLSDLEESADFALVYAVLHEAPDKERFIGEVYRSLKKGGMLFFGEPSGPVSRDFFREEAAMIEAAGFAPVAPLHRSSGMNAVFVK